MVHTVQDMSDSGETRPGTMKENCRDNIFSA